MKPSIYISNASSNWILRILGEDIQKNLRSLGYNARVGSYHDYGKEDIAFHMWWRTAVPYKEAKTNAVFVTHIDDKGKEYDLLLLKDKFDIFICMSEEDAQFLKELGFDSNKVFGISLPVRNTYVKPLVLAMFSNCYPDNRKNEKWIIDYCRTHEDCKYVIFMFLGRGWEYVGKELNELHSSFVWYSISRDMPHEYFYQQLAMMQADYYLYMGMDGGAMGSYDAYALGLNLCISDDGYHKSIPDIEYSFTNQQGFEKSLDEIIEKQKRKINFFTSHSGENYTKKLAYILCNRNLPEDSNIQSFDYSVKEKRRGNYFRMTLHRLKQPFVTKYLKFKKR